MACPIPGRSDLSRRRACRPTRLFKWRPAAPLGALLLSCMITAPSLADAQYFHKTFAGQIGGHYAFTMHLKDIDGTLTGNYRYTGKRDDIYLSGKIDPSGNFTMEETGLGGKHTGTFTGKVSHDTLDGIWASTGGARRLPVAAHQTSEIIIGSKRAILTQAMGAYVLDNVAGSGGANGMWDTSRDKGRWVSSESAISMARRESSEVDLSHEDVRRLDSMAITVDKSLAVHLSVNGRMLLSIPYRDAGMQYEIGHPHDSVVEDDLKMLSSATTVHDERLYLLARDAIDFLPAISGAYLPADDLDIVTVSYDVIGKTFEVSFREGNCCDETDLTFRRQPSR